MSPKKISPSSTSPSSNKSGLALAALIAASVALHSASGAVFNPLLLRSGQYTLPESLERETSAAIERSCDFLEEADGAENTVAQLLSIAPWDAKSVRKATLIALDSAVAGKTPPQALIERLSFANVSELPLRDRALASLALEIFGVNRLREWNAIISEPIAAKPDIGNVAAAALARLFRAWKTSGSAEPPPDVISHMRFISKRIFSDDLSKIAPDAPAFERGKYDSATVLLVTTLCGSIPRKFILEQGSDILPYNWRSVFADGIIANQKYWKGDFVWEDSSTENSDAGSDTVSATSASVLALKNLLAR